MKVHSTAFERQFSSYIDPVFTEDKAGYLNNTPLTVYEGGQPTKRFYTASFEPVWIREDDGMRVGGVHQIALNNTETIRLQEERQKESTTLNLAQQVAQIVCFQWDVPTGNLTWIHTFPFTRISTSIWSVSLQLNAPKAS